jgi:hypothetical protein
MNKSKFGSEREEKFEGGKESGAKSCSKNLPG